MSEESRRMRLEIAERFENDPEGYSKAMAVYGQIRTLESDLWNLQSELRMLMAQGREVKNKQS